MATTVTNESLTPGVSLSERSHTPRRPKRSNRTATAVVGLVLVGGAVAALSGMSLLGVADNAKMLTHPVGRVDLTISVTEDGNVESANNVDIRCSVAGGGTILWIIPDGTAVKSGDELVKLDTAAIEEQISAQKIVVEKAQATKIQAEKDYAAAAIGVTEYVEGLFLQTLQTLQSAATVAQETLNNAESVALHSEKMLRKGYITELQRDADLFAVEKAKLDLETAQLAIEVLEKYTKAKTVEQLESLRDSAKARMDSERTAYDLEVGRLQRFEAQMANCLITAPQDGMVVYANDSGGRFSRSDAPRVEEGAIVRERQTLIRLPDLSQMQVKCTVHETKVEQLAIGMKARIEVQDRDLFGSVTSIANQPEPNAMFSANVKEYATVVRMDGTSDGLKPGMTAQVEIFVAELKDVIALPVQAIVDLRGKFYCWVKTPDGPEKRLLVLGASNNLFVEVKDGIVEGEEVLLNPRAMVAEAREDESLTAGGAKDAKDKAGDAEAGDAGTPIDGALPGEAGGLTPGAGGPGAETKRGPGPGAGGGAPSIAALDKDGDGKLSVDEAPEQMQQNFDRLDGNADGFLDASELAAMRARRTKGGGGPGGGPGEGGPGGGGPGGGGGGGFGPRD